MSLQAGNKSDGNQDMFDLINIVSIQIHHRNILFEAFTEIINIEGFEKSVMHNELSPTESKDESLKEPTSSSESMNVEEVYQNETGKENQHIEHTMEITGQLEQSLDQEYTSTLKEEEARLDFHNKQVGEAKCRIKQAEDIIEEAKQQIEQAQKEIKQHEHEVEEAKLKIETGLHAVDQLKRGIALQDRTNF